MAKKIRRPQGSNPQPCDDRVWKLRSLKVYWEHFEQKCMQKIGSKQLFLSYFNIVSSLNGLILNTYWAKYLSKKASVFLWYKFYLQIGSFPKTKKIIHFKRATGQSCKIFIWWKAGYHRWKRRLKNTAKDLIVTTEYFWAQNRPQIQNNTLYLRGQCS